ncbi:DNA primase [Marinoscillum furvescens]|uniref:DNA primase catalytic core n=1 Tax=Marinoscillum furvescens DSM 4134 TaxID=1122208 RepID=A0A3D9L705_MARFU|nr:DNA primase [Marinoscillum furvescens]REE01080.1 DNA primase catalytic core [Marinoscillum furvescens DSM 4134]
MYIKQSFIDRIKDQAEITDIIGRYADLKRQGKNFFCLSPFGTERTPSFCVDPDKQRFVDYHSDRSGDVISFIMEKESLPYPQAIEHLAGMLGMPVEYEDEAWAKEKAVQIQKKEELRPLLKVAQKLYVQELREIRKNQTDHGVLNELQKRGYTDHDITDWELGYAPGGRLIFSDLVKRGKLKEGQDLFLAGEKADKYWNRLIIPIHDENGLLIGFAGRDVSKPLSSQELKEKLASGESVQRTAKWINPKDTPLYKKDKAWFALHRAKDEIRKSGEAWLMEGYNDVIAWHKQGITNTIASCGTSITETQVRILKRYCSKVIFCLDGDAAGIKATIKQIPLFLAAGFQTEVCTLPPVNGKFLDPDDFSRALYTSAGYQAMHSLLQHSPLQEGFRILLDHYLGDGVTETEKAIGARKLAEVVASVPDEALKEIYQGWLTKESGLKAAAISRWVKTEQDNQEAEKVTFKRYQLPTEVKTPLSELIKDIERYQMFIANNRIWMMKGEERPYTFFHVSNFSIEIIQHMQDERFPMKLVRIRNIYNEERIFDVPSENLNTPQAFDNAMTNHGNFLWTGGRNEFQRLRQYLYDRMGTGQKIEVMGWQPDNFWVWNNGVTIPGKGTIPIDNNGVFKYSQNDAEVSYYIPSANKIYKNNSFKYAPQKKVHLDQDPPFSFSAYCSKMMAVHRSHAINGILFTVATTFLDIVEDKLGNFPLLFLYGPPSSGKDQLIECCQSFYGAPQSPIHLENKTSTAKAQIRKFAQFRNIIVHLSEFVNDPQITGLLKGFWDRRGYERGNIDSMYGTDTIPITSSVIFTGNHYPEADALITRIICEEMTKTEFSLDEKKAYQELKDMTKKGISGFTAQMLEHRQLWKEKFKEIYRRVESNLKKDFTLTSGHDRMIGNIAVLGATYELMKDVLQFPFSFADFLEHNKAALETQVRKLNTASVIMKWWDCFLASVRTQTDPLRHGREFELKDDKLYFNFTHCYNKVIAQWWAQYHEQTPSKSKLTDVIKKDTSFIEEKNSHRMPEKKSSVWVIDLKKLSIYDDLYEAVDWQIRANQDLKPEIGSRQMSDQPKPVQGKMFNEPKDEKDLPF